MSREKYNYVTICITTISCGCVAHLYDINTDEHIAEVLLTTDNRKTLVEYRTEEQGIKKFVMM